MHLCPHHLSTVLATKTISLLRLYQQLLPVYELGLLSSHRSTSTRQPSLELHHIQLTGFFPCKEAPGISLSSKTYKSLKSLSSFSFIFHCHFAFLTRVIQIPPDQHYDENIEVPQIEDAIFIVTSFRNSLITSRVSMLLSSLLSN